MDIIWFYLTADVMEGVSFLPSLFDQVFAT